VCVDDLVAPLFVAEALDQPAPIESLPGVAQHTVASLVAEGHRLAGLGVPAIVLFGLPDPATKDSVGSAAFRPDGIVQRALGALRDALGDDIVLIADCCLDEFTDHGHCGVIDAVTGHVDNDATLSIYQEVAVSQAVAGADLVAPSGMMDGQVAAIRSALDEAGYDQTAIMAYAAKYASALYGPFREAVDLAGVSWDRRGYQQDVRNRREAMAEVMLDVAEGADVVMVKPALAYLDVISDVRAGAGVPVAAFHVSGEYAMVKAAAERGWIDGAAVALEHTSAIKRAGADIVLTYFAAELAEVLGA